MTGSLEDSESPDHYLAKACSSKGLRRHPLAVLAAAATVLLRPSGAAAQGPAARASDVSLDRDGDHTHVVVLLDGAVPVAPQLGLARISYRLAGTRASGRRRPSVQPDADGPVTHVELVAAGPDLELVIALRRPVAAHHLLAETPDGYELRIDLAETAAARPPPHRAPPPPPHAPAPHPPPRAVAPRVAPPLAPPAAPPPEQGRVLGGHVFLTPAGFASPFVDTRLGLTLGFARAAFPAIDARDGSRYTAQLGALALRANLGVRLTSRLGLVASGGGGATTGINGPTALNLGGDAGGTWMLGLAGVAARVERTGTQVAARISAEGTAGGRINSLDQLFNQAIAARQLPPFGALLGSLASTSGRFQWSAAQALGPHASAQASLGWGATWTRSPAALTEHSLDLTGGACLTVDAAPWVPLAVVVEYDGDAVLRRSGARGTAPSELLAPQGTSALLVGLYYSGRRDLLLGASGGTVTRGDGPAHTEQQGRVTLGYFF